MFYTFFYKCTYMNWNHTLIKINPNRKRLVTPITVMPLSNTKGISCHSVIIPIWIVHSWLILLITPPPLPPPEASIAPSWPMKATQQGISQDQRHFSRSCGQCVWCLHTCLTIKFWRASKNQDNIMYFLGEFLEGQNPISDTEL